jgi:hypothetical protein
LAGLLAAGAGCPTRPPRIYPPSIDPSAAGRAAIEMFDSNKDGILSGAELDKCPGLKAALPRVAPAGHGVTAEMIAARIRSWQEMKIGRMPVVCTVLRNGKPLEGAEVKFVPEKFLGGNIQVATGKTDKVGAVSISVPTSGDRFDPPGMPPGFYRIEVRKAGLDIPAKYNTATILGEEIAFDAPVIRDEGKGITLDLKF